MEILKYFSCKPLEAMMLLKCVEEKVCGKQSKAIISVCSWNKSDLRCSLSPSSQRALPEILDQMRVTEIYNSCYLSSGLGPNAENFYSKFVYENGRLHSLSTTGENRHFFPMQS